MAGLCCSYDCSCKTKRNRRIWLFLSVLFVIGAGLAIGGGVAGATSGCFSKFQDCKSVELSASVCKDQADKECGFTTYVAVLATGCALCGVVVPMIALLFCCCCTTPEPYQTDSTIPMHTLGGYPSSPPYTASFYSSNVYPKSQYTASTASQISGPPSQRWPQNGDLHAIISPKSDPTKPGTKQQLPPSFAPESYPPIEEASYSYTPQLQPQPQPLEQQPQQPQRLQAGLTDGAPPVTASSAMPAAAASTTPRYEQPVEAPVGLATPEYVHDGELVDHADAAAAADMAGMPAGLRGIRVRESFKEVSSYTPAQAGGPAVAGAVEGRRYAPGLATSRGAAADAGAGSYAPALAASHAAAAAPNEDGRGYAPALATSRVVGADDRERVYTRPGATSRLARFEPTGMRLSDYEREDEPEEDPAAAGMGHTSVAAGIGYTNRQAAASMGPQEHEQPQRRYAPAAAGSRAAHREREDEYAAPAAIPSREEWSNNSRAGMPPTAMGGMSRQRDSSPAPAWAVAAPEPQYTPESATRAPYLDPRISLDGGPRDREVLLAQQHGSAEVPGRGRRLDWDASQLGGRSRGPRTHSPSGRRLRTIADLQ